MVRRGSARSRAVRSFRWTPAAGTGAAPAIPVPAPGYRAAPLPLEAADLGMVADVLNRVYAGDPERTRVTPDSVREIAAYPGLAKGASFGLFHGPSLVGFCLALATPDGQGAIDSLGILEEHRGRALGLYLVRLTCEALAAFGAESVDLAVVGDNEPALQTYRKAGFKLTACNTTHCPAPTGDPRPGVSQRG